MTDKLSPTDHADRGPGWTHHGTPDECGCGGVAPSWDGKPPFHATEGWHMLRRRAKGFPGDGREEPWRYVPGASYRYNGPQITPWHSIEHGVSEERHVAWDWEYVGRLIFEQEHRHTQPVVLTDSAASLAADLDDWHEYACFTEGSAPDFWDETDSAARIAEWLVARGWQRVVSTHQTQRDERNSAVSFPTPDGPEGDL